MPQTPFSFGDTSGKREEEPRWFEPVLIEPVPVARTAGTIPLAVREGVRWKEIQWFDFATDAAADEVEPDPWVVSRVPTVAPAPPPALLPPPLPVAPPPAIQAAAPPAAPVVRVAEEIRVEDAESVPIIEPQMMEHPLLEADAIDDFRPLFSTAPYRTVHRSRLAEYWESATRGMHALSAARLSRVAQIGVFAAVVAAIVGVTYEGGEQVAGRAGATTPPPSTPYTDGKLAALPKENLSGPSRADTVPVPPPPTDEAASRAVSFLARANAGDPIAQYNVAVLYARGEGLAQDYGSANAWFLKAAETGNLAAQFNLGVMYQRGLGVQQDHVEAVRWYRKAAEHRYAPAEYNLAIAYAEGQGTPKDPVAAARWYHLAATQGLTAAMINFAILYEKGEGVERSPIDAYAWYHAAAQRGDGIAEKRAGEVLGQLDATGKKQAQAQAVAVAAMIRLAPGDLAGVAQPAGEASPSVLNRPAVAADRTASRN